MPFQVAQPLEARLVEPGYPALVADGRGPWFKRRIDALTRHPACRL